MTGERKIHRTPFARLALRTALARTIAISLIALVVTFGALSVQMALGSDPALGPKIASSNSSSNGSSSDSSGSAGSNSASSSSSAATSTDSQYPLAAVVGAPTAPPYPTAPNYSNNSAAVAPQTVPAPAPVQTSTS